jgi:dynamin 1-like protein
MMNLLVECLKPTNQMVKNLIVVQDAYINTYHPNFMGGANSIFSMFDPQEQLKQQEEFDQKKA